MKVEVQHLSPVKKSMSVEVEPEVAARELHTVLRGYASKARIPGFRPGKAPISVVRSHFGREVDEDLRERMVARYYTKAAREEGLEPLGNPVLEEVDFDEGRPFRFKTTFEVLPPVEPTGYKGIELRRRKPEVASDEVDKVLEELRQSRLQLVPVEGPAEAGHVLQVDLTGVPDRGEPFEREKILLEVGGASQPAAFAANLVGAVPGDERQFEVAYPEGQESGGMAGRTVAYTVRVHEVKRKQIPELDDEFARDLGEEFDDLAALRAKVEGDLLQRKRHEVEGELRQGLLDKVLLANPIVLPEVLVNSELQHRLEQFVRNLILQGVDPEKVQLDWEKLREQQLEPARKSVHARLILDAIGRLESIEVSADEVQQRIRRDAEQMGEKPDKLRKTLEKHSGLQALQNQMLREKALDLLMAVANIQNEE